MVDGVVCTTVACNVMQCGGMRYPDMWGTILGNVDLDLDLCYAMAWHAM